MSSYDSALQEIKSRIDIVDLISEYINLKKAGQNWKGLCPFHSEKTPSFTVSPAKQIFHCFGCGTGGDIFTFLARHETLTFPEAMTILAKKAGVTINNDRKSSVQTGEKETLLNIHKEALVFFKQQLPRNEQAQSYLNGRGISRDIQNIFSLGYAPKSWNALLNHLTRQGYKVDDIKKAGLAVQGPKGQYDTFRDRIIFPICNLQGDVIAFGGRSIDGSEPKYLNSPETLIFNKRKVLYGLDRAKDAIKNDSYVLFMEGYTDVITAHMFGFTNAVAPLGTAFTQEHGKLIKRFAENIILVFDSDSAGKKAARNAASILLETGTNVQIILFPDNEDPDSFLKKNGKDAFSRLLEHPLSIVDFIVGQGGKKHMIADEVFEIISKIPNAILQNDYIVMLSEKLNVDLQTVRSEFEKMKKKLKIGHREPMPGTQPVPRKLPIKEVYLIKLLLQMPERSQEICSELSLDNFKDEILRGLYQKIKEGLTDFNELVLMSAGEEKNVLTKISLDNDFEDPEKVLSDCINGLKNDRRKILLHELQGKINEAEQRKDSELIKKLQTEQHTLLKSRHD